MHMLLLQVVLLWIFSCGSFFLSICFSQEVFDLVNIFCDHRLPIPADQLKKTVTITAVGDLMMAGSALSTIRKNGYNYPFDSTTTILGKADIAIANLEAPFTNHGNPFNKKFTFRAPPEFIHGVINAGFDILTLANNHILDFGPTGLESTLYLLDSLKLHHCGAGNNLDDAEKGTIITIGKWKIGFLAYSLTYPAEFWSDKDKSGTVYPEPNRIKNRIQEIKKTADYVVVSFHWGGELKTQPKTYQKVYARKSIDCGADIILGHHPHILQGIEIYKSKLIVYSLGNFVFGSYSRNSRNSMILKIILDRQGILLAEVIPINVNNYEIEFQPRLLKDNRRNEVIQNLNRISLDLNHGIPIISDSGVIYPDNISQE